MAERFSASTAFTNMNNNNNATDGWGDDWGDWGNETPASGPPATDVGGGPPKPFSSTMQPPPVASAAANTVTPNQYFQPSQKHPTNAGQYFDGSSGASDQQNRNYLPNVSQGYPGAGDTGAVYHPMQQETMVPPQQQHPYSSAQPPWASYGVQQQTNYGQATSFYNSASMPPAPAAAPPSRPSAAITPQQQQQLITTFNQTISDSFDTSAGNSWNWNVADTSHHRGATPGVSQQPASESMVKDEATARPTSTVAAPQKGEDAHPQTHGPLQNAHLQRLKAETLSPQWSIESQVSSSDRSMESENNHQETKSMQLPPPQPQPTTMLVSREDLSGVTMATQQPPPSTTNDGNDGEMVGGHYNQPSTGYSPGYQTATPQVGVPDRLDEVLQSLSVKQEPADSSNSRGNVTEAALFNSREQSFPPPPPSIAGSSSGPMINESLHHASKSASTTPPLPPPPVDNGNATGVVGVGPPPGPSATTTMAAGPPPKPGQSGGSSSNPFKRAGGRTHIATPGLTMAPPSSNAAAGPYYYQQQQQPLQQQQQPIPPVEEANNVETLTPENQEILVEPRPSEAVENHEIAPSNDRNQYLQTGHLSEDGYGSEVTGVTGTTNISSTSRSHPNSMAATSATGAVGIEAHDRRLPPPGLLRYVPGQNQQQPDTTGMQPAGQSFPEPPPGLDRMVPGMDPQENASNLSLLERQADGEVSDSTPATSAGVLPPAMSSSSSGHVSQHYHHHHDRVDMSDRNLYRVPGESDNHPHNQQRVVPGGVENDRPAPTVSSTASAYGAGVGGAAVQVATSSAATAAGALGASVVASLDMPEEQRELVMDGENPDDQREGPLVGGNPDPARAAVGAAPASLAGAAADTDSNVTTIDTTSRNVEPSNTSTADESDKGGGFYGAGGGSKGRREDDSLRRSNKSKSSRDRYDTEDSDYSEHERRRRERESSLGATGGGGAGSTSGGAAGGGGGSTSHVADAGSHRHHERLRHRTTGGGERDKEKRKDTGRDRDRGERDRDRDGDRGDRDYDYRDRDRNRYDRDRERYGRSSKYDRDSRYETDGSKYETERSTRYDKDDKRYGGSSRDDYYRKRGDERGPGGEPDSRAAGRDRDRDATDRQRQRKEKERSDRYRGEDRRKAGGDDRYRDGDKRRDRRYDPEDYRTGSRNGTDREQRVRDSRERDDRKEKVDRKYLAGYGSGPSGAVVGASAGAYGPAGSYYDPYSYYAQHQQYYEQLRRTNPQAYAEMYRTYYAQMQASQLQRDLLTTDGRESVHSGRSSANDKERFNRSTPFMHAPPGLYANPEEYHRHYNNQSLPSASVGGVGGPGLGPVALLEQSYHLSGDQPSSLPPMFRHAAQAFQHHQQQHHQAHSLLHQQQQPQQQLRASTSLALDRTYQHGGDAGGYFQPRMDHVDASKGDTSEMSMMEPERLTPRKFPEIHPIVSVSAGLLISTKNRLTMNGMADTVKIFSLGYSDASRKLFQAYPGPLVKGVTHKKSVIEFCEEQLRQGPPYSGALALIKSRGNSINSLHSSSLAPGVNRSSFALLWNYIILLLRQNGTFVGTDISELLMQNKTEYPFESLQASAIRSANISGRNSSLSVAAVERNPREADARQDGESDEAADASPDAASRQDSKEQALTEARDGGLTEQEITDKFRNYLLYGNIGEALEWATEHNLWGHALFLASKVDSRQHANVMMKFANKLTLNDPLQTLYQLLSGRTPASVTSVLDERWGDWRPHLAMLMSNSSAKPELIKKSITTLGDTLYHRGDLYAAHFCYLLSDVAFGRFADVKQEGGASGGSGAVRLVLLGAAHHNRNFRELSTNESIMMTEIYEYARSLNEDRYSIAELQRYKYLLACRMLDQGLQLKCLLYMEQIAEQIQNDSYQFDTEFVRKVYTLGDRLKYYDPVMEKALDESVDNTGRGNIYANVEDPQWLKRLNEILLSNTSVLGGSVSNYNSNEGQQSYDYSSYGQGLDHTQTANAEQAPVARGHATETSDINKQFSEISQQLGQLNLQYSDQQQPHEQSQQQQLQHQLSPAAGSGSQLQPPQSYETGAIQGYDQGYESINQQHSLQDAGPDDQAGVQQSPDMNNYDQSQQQQLQQQQQQQFNQYNSYDQQQQQQSISGANIFTPGLPPGSNDQAAGPYDGAYWGAAPGNSEAPKPTISMPNAVSNRPGFNDETDEEHHRNQAASNGGMMKPQPTNAAQGKKAPAGKDGKAVTTAGAGGAQGSGWFGGIWNKFSLKPKNQMILPDDKNPKIVWDEVSKRWVNTDEAEAEAEAYKPPPKMSDLMPKASGPIMAISAPPAPSPMGGSAPGATGGPVPLMQPGPPEAAPGSFMPNPTNGGAMQQQQQQQPIAQPKGAAASTQSNMPVGEPTKVPTLQSNMYKMQRNRTLKRSYVDVFNPSGAAPRGPTEPILAPAVPSMPTAQAGFFVPGGPSAGQQSNEAAEGVPQFYNPNQFGGGAASSSYQQ